MHKNRKAMVLYENDTAGIIEETDKAYRFTYNNDFANKGKSISASLPSNQLVYESPQLFPFFKGLLPEGWYLDIVLKKLKIDDNDDFGLLLATCEDLPGAVSIKRLDG